MQHLGTIIKYNRKETRHIIPRNIRWAWEYMRQVSPAWYYRDWLGKNYESIPSHQMHAVIAEIKSIVKMSYKESLCKFRAKINHRRTRPDLYREKGLIKSCNKCHGTVFSELIASDHYDIAKIYLHSPWFDYHLLEEKDIMGLAMNASVSMVWLFTPIYIFYNRPIPRQIFEILLIACKIGNKHIIKSLVHMFNLHNLSAPERLEWLRLMEKTPESDILILSKRGIIVRIFT